VKLVVRFASPLTSSYTAHLVRLGRLVAPNIESFANLASEEEVKSRVLDASSRYVEPLSPIRSLMAHHFVFLSFVF
jgi:hypothetical protein